MLTLFFLGDRNDRSAPLRISVSSGCPLSSLLAANAIPRVPAIKIAQFLAAGCDVVVLLADIHGFLDNLKAPVELVEYRVEYYRLTITALLKAVGVSTQLNNLTIVQGSSYQKTAEYVMDIYKLSSSITEHEAKRAGAEIVKQSDSAPLSGLLYPVLQVLDEQYLDVDAQFGGKLYYNPQLLDQYLIQIGLDQRKLFIAAKEWLPKLGYRQVRYHYRAILILSVL